MNVIYGRCQRSGANFSFAPFECSLPVANVGRLDKGRKTEDKFPRLYNKNIIFILTFNNISSVINKFIYLNYVSAVFKSGTSQP